MKRLENILALLGGAITNLTFFWDTGQALLLGFFGAVGGLLAKKFLDFMRANPLPEIKTRALKILSTILKFIPDILEIIFKRIIKRFKK